MNEKKKTKKEQQKTSLLNIIKNQTKALKEEIKRQKQKNTPFKLLIVVSQLHTGHLIREYLNEKGIFTHFVLYSNNFNMESIKNVLGTSEFEQSCVFALLDSKLNKNLIEELAVKFELDGKNNGFACLVPPSSATLETMKMFMKNYRKSKGETK